MRVLRARPLTVLALLATLGCAPPPDRSGDGTSDGTGSSSSTDAGTTQESFDAGNTGGTGGTGGTGTDDGTPTRETCSNHYGTAISTAFGRLDGYLVAIVPPGSHSCNGDSDHVHLQVKANGAIYDIAVNVQDNNGADVFLLQRDLAMPDGAWSEGWHAGVKLDYAQLGLHANAFTAMPKAQIASAVEDALSQANHVSIFGTGYTDHTGAHKIHRNGYGEDGAIVIDPLSTTSHLLFFHFQTQSF